MSFELPASIEREVQLYAQSQQISPTEAVVKLLQDALKAKKSKSWENAITEAELQQLRLIPTFSFFEGLSEEAITSIETTSKQIRSERFASRG